MKTVEEGLKELKVLSKFKKNCIKSLGKEDCEEDLSSYIDSGIAGSFTWAETPEGHKFWENIDNKLTDLSDEEEEK